jgi:hypothetical protein
MQILFNGIARFSRRLGTVFFAARESLFVKSVKVKGKGKSVPNSPLVYRANPTNFVDGQRSPNSLACPIPPLSALSETPDGRSYRAAIQRDAVKSCPDQAAWRLLRCRG